MGLPRLIPTALFVFWAVLALPALGEPADEPPPALSADAAGLRQVLVEHRIETARPRPGLALYMRDAGLAFSERLARWIAGVLPRLARFEGPMIEQVLKLLLALMAAALLGFSIRFALLRWRQRPRVRPPGPIREIDGAADEPRIRPAAYWEAELRRRLDAGEVAAATLALWWWLASGLVGDRARPSWTTRELIARAGRRDLTPGVRRLDRMIYGNERPSAESVDRLWRELREALG